MILFLPAIKAEVRKQSFQNHDDQSDSKIPKFDPRTPQNMTIIPALTSLKVSIRFIGIDILPGFEGMTIMINTFSKIDLPTLRSILLNL